MRDLAKLCVLFMVVACGGDGNNLPDGPPQIDGPPGQPDAPPPMTAIVNVSQEDNDPSPGTAIAGATIAAFDPGSTTPRLYNTDAAGHIEFPVMAGSRVWVGRDPVGGGTILPGGGGSIGQLYLIESVSPGDVINLGARPPAALASADGTLTINYTPFGGGAYGFTHDYFNGSDGGTEPVPGQLVYTTYAGYEAPTREIVISAYDLLPPYALVAHLHVPGVSPVPGTIDATTLTWDTAIPTYTATQTGLPIDLYYARTAIVAAGSWHAISMGNSLVDGAATYSVTDASIPTPAIVLTRLDHQTGSPQFIADPIATIPADLAVDSANLLPFISFPSFDETTRTISWTSPTTGAVAPQLVTASFNYYDSVDSTQYRWTVYAPGTTTSLMLPDVPDTITTHDLQPTDLVYPDVWLVHVDGSSLSNLLVDVDHYRYNLENTGYRPTSRALVSGGYAGGK